MDGWFVPRFALGWWIGQRLADWYWIAIWPFDKGIGQGLALHRRVGRFVRIIIGLEDLQWIGGLVMVLQISKWVMD